MKHYTLTPTSYTDSFAGSMTDLLKWYKGTLLAHVP